MLCAQGVWRSITPSNLNLQEILVDLAKNGNQVSEEAHDRLAGEDALKNNTQLVVVTIKQLGLAAGIRGKAIYTRAQELGLQVCSAAACPQLLHQNMDQSLMPSLTFVMQSTDDGDETPVDALVMFHGHNGIRCIEHFNCYSFEDENTCLVFVLPQQEQ